MNDKKEDLCKGCYLKNLIVSGKSYCSLLSKKLDHNCPCIKCVCKTSFKNFKNILNRF